MLRVSEDFLVFFYRGENKSTNLKSKPLRNNSLKWLRYKQSRGKNARVNKLTRLTATRHERLYIFNCAWSSTFFFYFWSSTCWC